MYADDTQLYLDFSPEDEVSAHATIARCVMDKGVNPCSNMGGIILRRNIHSGCGMYCVAQSAPSF